MSTRRFGPLVLAIAMVLGLAAGVAVTALVLRRAAAPTSVEPPHAHTTYVCPMHPSITSDKPGECPICGMQLVAASAPTVTEHKLLFYRSPMDPKVT